MAKGVIPEEFLFDFQVARALSIRRCGTAGISWSEPWVLVLIFQDAVAYISTSCYLIKLCLTFFYDQKFAANICFDPQHSKYFGKLLNN